MKTLRYIKDNFFILLYAALFSGMLVVSKHFVLRTDSAFSAHLKDVTIFDFHWFDAAAWLAVTVLLSALLTAVVPVLSEGLARTGTRPLRDNAGTASDASQDEDPGSDQQPEKAGGAAFFPACSSAGRLRWTFASLLGISSYRVSMSEIIAMRRA